MKPPAPVSVTLIGFGAIGQAVLQRAAPLQGVRISHVLVSPAKVQEVQSKLGDAARAVSQVPQDARLVLECAGHGALVEHVIPALERGVECAVLSIGALAEPGMLERVSNAAQAGHTQVHLLPGAIGAIDAIAAARLAGLDELVYIGRKPPSGWRGTAAEQVLPLDSLRQATVLLQSSAREAARLYPKNANVAAMVSLAGLGLDATQVKLIADPTIHENIHEVHARGAFGELDFTIRGQPLADNPKTSALTVLSALRFLRNRGAPISF